MSLTKPCFVVIPAEAGIQNTGSLRQRDLKVSHPLHDGDRLKPRHRKMFPIEQTASHQRSATHSDISALDPCFHRDDDEESRDRALDSPWPGTSSPTLIQIHSTKIAIDP